MSRVRADQYTNNAGTGSPLFPNGVRITGVATATTFNGNISGTTGSFTGNVSVGGTLTYEDVTNIDSVGIITARSDVSIADKIIHTGDTDTAIRFPAADTFTVETAGSERVRVTSAGKVGIGSDNPGATLDLQSTDTETLLRLNTKPLKNGYLDIVSDANRRGVIRFKDTDDTSRWSIGNGDSDELTNTSFHISSGNSGGSSAKLVITSRGGFHFNNGFMNETVKINTSARTGTQAVNLDDGMVHYFSTNSAGTWKPNFTMSTGDDINATIAIGDVFSPTMIVAKGADTHFANSAEVDGTTIGSIEFAGGAPTDGGASGTFDVYNYTIIKIGDDSFKAFVSVSNYE